MRPRVFLVGLAVAALTASCATGGRAVGDGTGDKETAWTVGCQQAEPRATATDFEQFTLACLSDGAEYRLGGLDGRPLVITLWASWCKPCRAEAAAFDEFHERLGDRVNLIGVDTQDDPDAGRSFAADAGWEFPSVADPKGSVMRSRGITALPATFFIDARGETVATYNEGELTAAALERAAAKHFGVRP